MSTKKIELSLGEQDHTICSFIADGKSTEWIAKKMKLSGRTIENKVFDLRKKVKAKNKTHLIAYLIREKHI